MIYTVYSIHTPCFRAVVVKHWCSLLTTAYHSQAHVYNMQYTIYNIQYTIYNIQYTINRRLTTIYCFIFAETFLFFLKKNKTFAISLIFKWKKLMKTCRWFYIFNFYTNKQFKKTYHITVKTNFWYFSEKNMLKIIRKPIVLTNFKINTF